MIALDMWTEQKWHLSSENIMEKTQQACGIKNSHKKQTLEDEDKFKILQMTRTVIFLTMKCFILYSYAHTIFLFFEIYFEKQNLGRQWSQLSLTSE